jgi:hypothetical protein
MSQRRAKLQKAIEVLCDAKPLLSHLIRARVNERNWVGVFCLFERHNAADVFALLAPGLADDEYWAALGRAYLNMDAPLSDSRMEGWLRSIRPYKSSIMSDESDRATYASLPDSVEIYRGCRGREARALIRDGEAGSPAGWSWTLDEEIARWFAAVHEPQFSRSTGDDAAVVAAQVRKVNILAVINDRREQEVLVDPLNVAVKRVYRVEFLGRGAFPCPGAWGPTTHGARSERG